MKTRVLFLSTVNAGRSQMAEAFLRKYAGDAIEVYSAGLEPTRISPDTQEVMDEVGIDTHAQTAKDVMEYMGKLHFSYLITVCGDAEQNCPSTFPDVAQRLHWSFENPAKFEGTAAERLVKYRQVRDEIDLTIQKWLQELELPGVAVMRP